MWQCHAPVRIMQEKGLGFDAVKGEAISSHADNTATSSSSSAAEGGSSNGSSSRRDVKARCLKAFETFPPEFIDVVTATPAEVDVSSQAGWHCAQLLGSASCGTCSGTCCACKYIAALTPCFCSCAGHSPWCVLCVHVLICSTLSLHHQYSALQSLSQTPGDL